jgi:PAS domain S-box-containing protein
MARGPIRVLLIEDEEADYVLTRRLLSGVRDQQYDLKWANSWKAGIEAIRNCAHDVCLLDYRIGGGDGLELLKESRDIRCKAPVILLTGIGDYRLDIEAMELGAADFLVKDRITPELLERSIRYAIANDTALNELQQQRDELRASELRFRSVVESAADGIILADDAKNIVGWNKGAEGIFGYSEDEILGASLEVLVPEQYRELHQSLFERFRVTGRSPIIGRTLEIQGLRKDGTTFPLEVSLACWRHGAGMMFTGIVREISERKHVEVLSKQKEAAEEANRAKSTFIARISHELRTPLHAIIGFTNVMLQNKAGNLVEQDSDFLQRILLNAKDQLQLINGILDVSRMEAGKMDLSFEDTSIGSLVSDVAKQLDAERRNPDVELVLHVPEVMAPIQTDIARLKQVLVNLIENALKFTTQGAVTVDIEVSPFDLRPTRIHVTDTGVGIPEERIQEIFEPFRQLEDSPNRQEGSGLGLPISRSLCELMGYRLEVQSEPGHGSCFTIVLGAEVRRLPLSA